MCPQGATLCKSAANAPFRGWGDTLLATLSNVTFKQASLNILKIFADDFGFKYFHYSGHCAHRVANLCKSAANALFRGWGDTLLAAQKKLNFQISLSFLFELHFAGS